MIQSIFLLIAGHSLGDTALQTNSMAVGKNRHRTVNLNRVPKGQKPLNLWWMWLTHHSLIHGLIVFYITQNIYLGLTETIGHWIIDYFKCENKYSPYGDQALHIGMKLVYLLFI